MQVVNEGTTAVLPLSFLGTNGQPELPASVEYRIDAEAEPRVRGLLSVQVQDWTAQSPSASQITLDATDNAMVIEGVPDEIHVLTVRATYGAAPAQQVTGEFRYRVRRLRHLG